MMIQRHLEASIRADLAEKLALGGKRDFLRDGTRVLPAERFLAGLI
ncbi:MAG TPA: hypothetical protein PK668_05540 [Myxococcota bacterium]|nr:hypothetical protein [Myxococcota bacterium]HRY92697.1 hypothetical protein [Myxococcota bacterium]HSA22043.1 hypothetical protein [Myxococcota bacterium]